MMSRRTDLSSLPGERDDIVRKIVPLKTIGRQILSARAE